MSPDPINHASDLIEKAGLNHPYDELLHEFIYRAVDQYEAAHYAIQRIAAGEAQQMADDWVHVVKSVTTAGLLPPPPSDSQQRDVKLRDGGRCCITGKTGSLWDPLVVAPILPIPSGWIDIDNSRIHELLGVFFTPSYRDWWLGYAARPSDMNPLHSHWLVQRSAASAFANGFVRLQRFSPSLVEFRVEQVAMTPLVKPTGIRGLYPVMVDQSRNNLAKVDARFIGTQARLASTIQLVAIAQEHGLEAPTSSLDEKEPVWHPRRSSPFLLPLRLFGRALLQLWRLMPGLARLKVYQSLYRLGTYLYPTHGSASVRRLPFGLYLKESDLEDELDRILNEAEALRWVQRHSDVPVPRPLDVVYRPGGRQVAYLLMTRLPGFQLIRSLNALSARGARQIMGQLEQYLSQIRKIPNTANEAMAICNTLGGPIADMRLRGGKPLGPFRDEADFSNIMRYPDDPGRQGHEIVFTHADLNPRNILVDQFKRPDGSRGWMVTGIIDWEMAGFYPEYWEYTKSMFEGRSWPKRYNNWIHGLWARFGDYTKEMDVELRAWASGCAV
ncbi:kinase-like domain-containing protein [Apiosordaria backusii]|uniref:Kinase-like domain-containing protein n=1 Tax=Apiosordaria backusii TaxID=314023 RepID=A0AA40DL33_9PEZI|nr:kinase-like domain-containing protein [Apiosordaria backusii]